MVLAWMTHGKGDLDNGQVEAYLDTVKIGWAAGKWAAKYITQHTRRGPDQAEAYRAR
jgi:hypothetical protein